VAKKQHPFLAIFSHALFMQGSSTGKKVEKYFFSQNFSQLG
jgi:hypothetical protein